MVNLIFSRGIEGIRALAICDRLLPEKFLRGCKSEFANKIERAPTGRSDVRSFCSKIGYKTGATTRQISSSRIQPCLLGIAILLRRPGFDAGRGRSRRLYCRLAGYRSIAEVGQQRLHLIAALPGVRVHRVVGLAERQGSLR
jgi:hypothetical protein